MDEQPLSILLIEDNPADATLVRTYLEEIDRFEVSRCEKLSSAITELKNRPSDVVLLDLNLPDAVGLVGLEKIQASFPEIPVVVLTGFASDDVAIATEAVKIGAQDYLFKGALEPGHLDRSLQLAVERKRLELYRSRWARQDPSTGLPRLQVLEERFERATARASRNESWITVAWIRVDRAEQITAELGHEVTETCVQIAAERLQRICRKSDTLARLQGPQFALLAEGMKHASDSHTLARKLVGCMREPVVQASRRIDLSFSVGIDSFGPRDNQPPLAYMLEAAQEAMERAQSAGGNGHQAAAHEAVAG